MDRKPALCKGLPFFRAEGSCTINIKSQRAAFRPGLLVQSRVLFFYPLDQKSGRAMQQITKHDSKSQTATTKHKTQQQITKGSDDTQIKSQTRRQFRTQNNESPNTTAKQKTQRQSKMQWQNLKPGIVAGWTNTQLHPFKQKNYAIHDIL